MQVITKNFLLIVTLCLLGAVMLTTFGIVTMVRTYGGFHLATQGGFNGSYVIAQIITRLAADVIVVGALWMAYIDARHQSGGYGWFAIASLFFLIAYIVLFILVGLQIGFDNAFGRLTPIDALLLLIGTLGLVIGLRSRARR